MDDNPRSSLLVNSLQNRDNAVVFGAFGVSVLTRPG